MIIAVQYLQNRKLNIGVIKSIKIMTVTTIPISKEFHDWLKNKGKKGESYEDVIKRLLKPEYKEEVEEGSSKESSGNADDIAGIDNL